MVHPKCCGAWRISTVPIGHQNNILVHDRFDGISIDCGENRTDCRAAAINSNQYRNLFI